MMRNRFEPRCPSATQHCTPLPCSAPRRCKHLKLTALQWSHLRGQVACKRLLQDGLGHNPHMPPPSTSGPGIEVDKTINRFADQRASDGGPGLSRTEQAGRAGCSTVDYRLERLKHELVHFLELPASQVLPPSVREQPLRPDTNPILAHLCASSAHGTGRASSAPLTSRAEE